MNMLISKDQLKNDLTRGTLRVIYHSAIVIPDHGLIRFGVGRFPTETRNAGLARGSESRPGRSHFLRKRLRFRCIARALFAALRVIEAELQFRGMPSAGHAVEHWTLPCEVIRVRGRRI